MRVAYDYDPYIRHSILRSIQCLAYARPFFLAAERGNHYYEFYGMQYNRARLHQISSFINVILFPYFSIVYYSRAIECFFLYPQCRCRNEVCIFSELRT